MQAGLPALSVQALFISLLVAVRAGAATCIWQGNGGAWGDTAHWSCAHVPSGDDCIIDASSITADGQTIDASSESGISCNTMNWTAAMHSPTFNMAPVVNINGDLTLIRTSLVMVHRSHQPVLIPRLR